jgi:hypothetical protein
MKEALRSSEMSVLTRATGRNNPEDTIFHSHRRENLKSYMFNSCLQFRTMDKVQRTGDCWVFIQIGELSFTTENSDAYNQTWKPPQLGVQAIMSLLNLPIPIIKSGISDLRPPLWSSGQSSWLLTQRSWGRFPALPNFLRSSGSRTGYTQPREDKWRATWKKSSGSGLEN